MKDEIKNIINNIKSYENEELCLIVLSQKENKALLNYITNLQDENERLNKDLYTAIDICNIRQQEIVRLSNIIYELDKELDKDFEVYICNGRKVSKSIELGYKICQKELLRKLKELKEGKE